MKTHMHLLRAKMSDIMKEITMFAVIFCMLVANTRHHFETKRNVPQMLGGLPEIIN